MRILVPEGKEKCCSKINYHEQAVRNGTVGREVSSDSKIRYINSTVWKGLGYFRLDQSVLRGRKVRKSSRLQESLKYNYIFLYFFTCETKTKRTDVLCGEE